MWLSGAPIPFLTPFLAGLFLIALPISAQLSQPESDRGTWRTAAPMPTKRTEVAVAALEGKIYVVGGFEKPSLGNLMSPAITPALDVYDPATDRWTSKAPLPTPRDHLAVATVAGKIYAIGGRVNGDYHRNLAITERYDPSADRWMRVSDLPTARSGIAAAVVGGEIYVFGGEGAAGTFSENETYDPASDLWRALASMPTARHGLGAAAVRGQIHVLSGGTTPGGSFSDLNEVFTPPLEANRRLTEKWIQRRQVVALLAPCC
jgi:N-acetylneuraminic acid mutarotase